jgi:hypothetical protein
MDDKLSKHILGSYKELFKNIKSTADKALEQLQEKDCYLQLDPESNSIAVIIQHMSGSILSRWTDFLTTDGEKKDRNRDSEFIDDNKSTEELRNLWDRAWTRLFETLNSLNEEDLFKTILIRAEPLSVVQALNRQLYHISFHTGQIVYIAKYIKSTGWKTLSVPKKR